MIDVGDKAARPVRGRGDIATSPGRGHHDFSDRLVPINRFESSVIDGRHLWGSARDIVRGRALYELTV